MKDKIRIKEAMEFLGLSESSLRHAVCARKIPYYKLGGSVYFSRSELEALIEAGRVPARGER